MSCRFHLAQLIAPPSDRHSAHFPSNIASPHQEYRPNRKGLPASCPGRPDLKLSERGVPLCQANVEMALRSRSQDGKLVFFCPVRAGKCEACPLAPNGDPHYRCEPDQNWGPTVTLNANDHPRICGMVPRNTQTFIDEYKARSGCERRNSSKKVGYKLVEARHRRPSIWLIRLCGCAILEHASAWVADADPTALVEHLLGRTTHLAQAA